MHLLEKYKDHESQSRKIAYYIYKVVISYFFNDICNMADEIFGEDRNMVRAN